MERNARFEDKKIIKINYNILNLIIEQIEPEIIQICYNEDKNLLIITWNL